MTPSAGTRSAVRSQPPPDWLMRHVVSPLARAVVCSPFGPRTGRLSLLRFVGRRTGRSYEIPVLVHNIDGEPTVITDGTWAVNFHGGHWLTVVNQGRARASRGEFVQDPRSVGPAIRAALAQEGNARRLGLAIDAGHSPTDAELCAVRSMIRLTRAV